MYYRHPFFYFDFLIITNFNETYYLFVLDKSIFVAGCAVLAFIVMSIIIGLIYFGWIRNTTPCVNEGNCFVNCYRYTLVDKFSNTIRTNIGVFFYNNMANDF